MYCLTSQFLHRQTHFQARTEFPLMSVVSRLELTQQDAKEGQMFEAVNPVEFHPAILSRLVLHHKSLKGE